MQRLAKSNWNYILAVALLATVIGGLAFGLQYLRTWNDRPAPDAGTEKPTLVCRIRAEREPGGAFAAVWDPEDKAYLKEIEAGEAGYYDFPFDNPSDQTGEMGLVGVSCTCSSVLVGFPEEKDWQKLVKDREEKRPDNLAGGTSISWVRLARDEAGLKTEGPIPTKMSIPLPARAKGVVRVEWDGRGKPGDKKLHAALWHKTADDERTMNSQLEVIIMFRAPLQHYPAKLHIGAVGPKDHASGVVYFWSATRPDVNFVVKDQKPLLTVRTEPLDEEGRAKLQAKLQKDESIHTRIRKAWKAVVTVYEEKEEGEKLVQHDLGPFLYALNVQVDGESLADAPLVTGGIRSDIHVGGDKDQGKVDLGIFNAGAGKSAKVVLWSGAGVLLEQVRHDPDFLRVRLVKQDKDADKRTKWQLEVTVPPDALYGSFPEKSAVYLRLNSTPPRLIRIPVVGTASGR